jgi:hypothetical protein
MREGAIKVIGVIKDNKFTPLTPSIYNNALQAYNNKIVDVFIIEHEEPKSSSQLGFYHGIIIRKVCMNTEAFRGWEENEIDKFFRSLFLVTRDWRVIEGRRYEIVNTESFSTISKKRLSVFIDKVINWLATQGIVVPDPSEVYVPPSK